MPPLEPVLLGEILIEAGQDTQDTPEIGQLDHVLCCFAALLEVPGQAPVARIIHERNDGANLVREAPPHAFEHVATALIGARRAAPSRLAGRACRTPR